MRASVEYGCSHESYVDPTRLYTDRVKTERSRLKYMIVNAPDLTDLHYKVNDQLSKGWRLQGGIAIFRGYPCQAMIKEESECE